MLEEIIAVPSENDFVTFEIKSVAPIAVTKKDAVVCTGGSGFGCCFIAEAGVPAFCIILVFPFTNYSPHHYFTLKQYEAPLIFRAQYA